MALSFARGAWFYIYTVTGTCIENIRQAISRDILCYAMKTLSHCRIVGHVHDELIIDVGKDASLKAICEQLGFDSLGYQSVEGLLEAIGLDKDKICTYCWTGKE